MTFQYYLLSAIVIAVIGKQGSVLGQGLLFDDSGYEAASVLSDFNQGQKNEDESLEGIYKIDLKPFCPMPQDQGFIASCTGWASGYGALTISHAISKGWAGQTKTITEHAYSALFIYNQIRKGSCEFGAYLSDAVAFLKSTGNILSRDFDLIKNNCEKLPNESLLDRASEVRIKDYVALFNAGDSPTVKVRKVKQALAQQKPVIIGFLLIQNFKGMRRGDHTWYPAIGDTSAIGGHAMVVVGFDDGKGAFEVMNSWGKDWANQGFAWIRYEDFSKYCNYAYLLVPQNDAVYKDFQASFAVRKPAYDAHEALVFEDLEIVFLSGYYTPSKGSVERKEEFLQPVLTKFSSDFYLYVFSFDPLGDIKVHWPRDGTLDARFEGQNESAFVAISGSELPIPGKYSALSFPLDGYEYICFLISPDPIEGLNLSLNKLRTASGGFNRRLQTVFREKLLDSEHVTYSSENMHVAAAMESGKILPVTLRIAVK